MVLDFWLNFRNSFLVEVYQQVPAKVPFQGSGIFVRRVSSIMIAIPLGVRRQFENLDTLWMLD
jgi:hypothetical protein